MRIGVQTLFLVMMLTLAISCGGGGTVNLGGSSDGDDGNDFDGTTGNLEDIYTSSLPGASTVESQSENYDAVIEVGSGVSVIDSYTDSGAYQLKSSLTFGD